MFIFSVIVSSLSYYVNGGFDVNILTNNQEIRVVKAFAVYVFKICNQENI